MLSILDSKWALFVKVTELGSLTHAASVLDMPQSVISRQIGVLERECGSRLFRRTGRGVVLTDFGQQIFPRVKALIAQADQLSDDIRTSSGQPLGDVRLGLLPSAATRFAGNVYRAVVERFPKVRLHFTEGSSVQLEDWLNQGRLDLSLLLREDTRELPGEPTLRKTSLSLIGLPGDPITSQPTVEFRQLANLPLVLPGEPHLLRARLDALALQYHVKLTVQVEADSIRLQEEIVAAGGGYAIVVASAMPATTSPRFSAALIVNPELLRRVVLSTTLLRPHTLATRAVSNLIQEIAPTAL
jgi:LysR family transcriptional regulator, nitrogen assimilation regulatory protein